MSRRELGEGVGHQVEVARVRGRCLELGYVAGLPRIRWRKLNRGQRGRLSQGGAKGCSCRFHRLARVVRYFHIRIQAQAQQGDDTDARHEKEGGKKAQCVVGRHDKHTHSVICPLIAVRQWPECGEQRAACSEDLAAELDRIRASGWSPRPLRFSAALVSAPCGLSGIWRRLPAQTVASFYDGGLGAAAQQEFMSVSVFKAER